MPIEFSCTGCSKQLRVSDESAGKDARCPECGGINRVPFSMPAPVAPVQQGWGFGDAAGGATGGNPFGAASTNPYAAPQAASYQPDYGQYASGPIRPTVVSVEPIWNHAWQVWQQNLGILVGVTVTLAVINWVISFVVQMVQMAVMQNNGEDVGMAVGLVGGLLNNAVQIFLTIGQIQIALKLVRRQPAEFTDLFGGGPRFLPVLGVSILVGLAIGFGFLLLIIPGIILALMLWPAYYLVVDEKAGVIESFTVASEITKGNWGTAFLLWLLSVAIMIVGFLALCIGVLFAAPLMTVLWATAYLMMSGQLSPYPTSQYATPQYPSYVKP